MAYQRLEDDYRASGFPQHDSRDMDLLHDLQGKWQLLEDVYLSRCRQFDDLQQID